MPAPLVRKKPVPTPAQRRSEKGKQKGILDSDGARWCDKSWSSKSKGKEKASKPQSAFERLPREIIQEILYAADPNTFDSLTLLNSCWHQASRNTRLYAAQLARCGIEIPKEVLEKDDLLDLTKKFAAEARRELFESVLRPSVTEIQLVCSASSSAVGFAGGEVFRFEFSAKGTQLLALSSSRIFVLDLQSKEIKVTRELKISRRPVSAAVLDDGSVLAVLSSNHHVTLYDLREESTRYLRSFPLDNEPITIALSPGAEVLGAAFNGGIEVYSLLEDALPTDKRAVNCDTVDSLAFSPDGTILLGTTLGSKSPTTVVVSAQHFSTDMPVEGLAQLWTTQVLFPRSSRDSSHAALLPGDVEEEGATWTFMYDRSYETFRAVRVEDLRNGHTYFTGPSDERGSVTAPTTLPAPTKDGGMAAAGFDGRIWLFGIPGTLDQPEESQDRLSATSTPERSNSNSSRSRDRLQSWAVPHWQVLSDKVRNVFIRGREVGNVCGLSGLKFIKSETGAERLIAVAGGGVDDILGDAGEEEFVAIGGGRVSVFEFGRGPRVGQKTVISIEIGDGIQGPVETLQEEHRDLEVEVDIVRRRTVAQRRTTARQSLHSIRTDVGTDSGGIPSPSAPPVPMIPRSPSGLTRRATVFSGATDTDLLDEDQEIQHLPYSHAEPRARTTLHRAATVARNTPQTVNQRRYARVLGPDGQPIRDRPMQSNGNNREEWSPPPPPYTPRNDNTGPLPAHLLWSMQGPRRVDEEGNPIYIQTAPVSPAQGNSRESERPPSRGAASALERTRSTFGNVMRRHSVFRHSTPHPPDPAPWLSVPDLSEIARRGSAPESAPVPPLPTIPPQFMQRRAPEIQHQPRPPPVQSRPVTSHSRRPSRSPSGRLPLRETYAPGAALGVPSTREYYTPGANGSLAPSPGRPVTARSARGSVRSSSGGNLRRGPSRAERSAAVNMRDARRRREERRASDRDHKGGRQCVIM